METKLPDVLAPLLTPDEVTGRHVRLLCQDEARLGRMVRIRRCGAPAPQRPVVDTGYEREYHDVYGAGQPAGGRTGRDDLPRHAYRTDGTLPGSRPGRPP